MMMSGKKIRIIVWFALLAALVLCSIRSDRVTITRTGISEFLPETAAPTVTGKDAWKTAYGDFILNRECDRIGYPDYLPDGYDITAMTDGSDKLSYTGYDTDPIWFTLYDMDNDGTPELIIFNGYGYMAGNMCHVYTCRNGSMKYLGTMGRRELMWTYSDDRTYPGLIQTDGNMGHYLTDYWYISNDELCCETLESISYYTDPDSYFPDETSDPIVTCETDNANMYGWYKANTFRLLDHWDYETLDQHTWNDFVDTFYPN